MFVGHYGVALAAKPLQKPIPLWVWFIAVQWMDVLWSILVLLGVEKLHIVPRFTEANALDLYYMPFTHGLPGSIAVSAIFGLIVTLIVKAEKRRTFLLITAAAFSHWILDLIVHVPDLPLYADTAKVGLGLWRHVAMSFPLELAFLGGGAWLYARDAKFAGRRGQVLFWGFIVLMAGFQVYANFGPPPASPNAMALMALGLYVVLAALAAAMERFALERAGQS